MKNQNFSFLSTFLSILSLFIILLCANGEVMAEHKVYGYAEPNMDIQRITKGPACDHAKCTLDCQRDYGLVGFCDDDQLCHCNGNVTRSSAKPIMGIQRITKDPACDRVKCIIDCQRDYGLIGFCGDDQLCHCNGNATRSSAEPTMGIQRITKGHACNRAKCILDCQRLYGFPGYCGNDSLCHCNGNATRSSAEPTMNITKVLNACDRVKCIIDCQRDYVLIGFCGDDQLCHCNGNATRSSAEPTMGIQRITKGHACNRAKCILDCQRLYGFPGYCGNDSLCHCNGNVTRSSAEPTMNITKVLNACDRVKCIIDCQRDYGLIGFCGDDQLCHCNGNATRSS